MSRFLEYHCVFEEHDDVGVGRDGVCICDCLSLRAVVPVSEADGDYLALRDCGESVKSAWVSLAGNVMDGMAGRHLVRSVVDDTYILRRGGIGAVSTRRARSGEVSEVDAVCVRVIDYLVLHDYINRCVAVAV